MPSLNATLKQFDDYQTLDDQYESDKECGDFLDADRHFSIAAGNAAEDIE